MTGYARGCHNDGSQETAERDEWVRRVGTEGWREELLRRDAVRLSTSPYASPQVRARWVAWLAAYERRHGGG